MCNIKKSRNLARKSRHWAIAEDVTGASSAVQPADIQIQFIPDVTC